MYEYLKGKLVESFPGKAIVEANGLGYALLMPLNNYPKLPQVGKEILLYLSLIIREEAHTLFAFLTRSERELFNRLTQVSGIGPKTALALVGHMEASDLQMAISQANLAVLCKVPGIGKKTAERLIVDLRDTLKKSPQLDSQPSEGISSDALNALIHLGYHPLQAQKAIHSAMQRANKELDLPQLITEALEYLMVEVITADEMRRIEKLAYDEGFSDAEFMEKAGASIAEATETFILKNQLEKTVTLLIGKGNNGGDALVAGRYLLEKGFTVHTHLLYPIENCSLLCQSAAKKFVHSGGNFSRELLFQGVILDGLLGTGFKGKIEEPLTKIIEKANGSSLPILAIDIPSGLNGNTGEVGSIAIKATQTLFLGRPKLGFFLQEGWNHVGKLIPIDFGLPQKFLSQAHIEAIIPSDETLKKLLPSIKRTRHKYESGYVVAFAGSPGMSGAAILSSYAALKTGAGIVRLFHTEEITEELIACPWEIIKETLQDDLENLLHETKRARCLLIGPGLGRTPSIKEKLLHLFPKLTLPCVIDADALYFLGQWSHWSLPQNCVLTPHHGEMEKLVGEKPTLSNCQQLVEEKKVTLILKGAPTIIFHPSSTPTILTHGDPGMATAGSGDVLTGIVAGLMAQKLTAKEAAMLGVYLHGLAGEAASTQKTSYSLIASDLIEFLPKVFSIVEKN